MKTRPQFWPPPARLALGAALPMAQPSGVEGRVKMILSGTRRRRALTRGGMAAAVGLASILAVALATAQAPPPDRLITPPDVTTLRYRVQEIGPSAGFEDQYFLNDKGETAGLVFEPEGNARDRPTQFGNVWTQERPRARLGMSPAQDYYIPKGINSGGEIIAQKIGRNGGLNWFVGTRETLMPFHTTPACRRLTAAGFQLSELSGLNDSGWLLLNAYPQDRQKGWNQAFVWHDDRLVQLKPLADTHLAYSGASAVNDSGWAVGDSEGQAVLWKGDMPRGLGVLPDYVASAATGLNERGDVIGTLSRKGEADVSPFLYGERSHAFVWRGGEMQELGNLPGRQYAAPIGINDAEQIVGNSWSNLPVHVPHHPTAYSVATSAILWQSGKTYDLQRFLPAGSPWRLERACALNNRGQIVALAWDGRLPPSAWTLRAVLLTPQ